MSLGPAPNAGMPPLWRIGRRHPDGGSLAWVSRAGHGEILLAEWSQMPVFSTDLRGVVNEKLLMAIR